jgi:hypothetical protein
MCVGSYFAPQRQNPGNRPGYIYGKSHYHFSASRHNFVMNIENSAMLTVPSETECRLFQKTTLDLKECLLTSALVRLD